MSASIARALLGLKRKMSALTCPLPKLSKIMHVIS